MRLGRDQLATLAAVLRHGSFEAAAAELNVTQPAVSLRIRALEETIGLPLVRRGTPCTETDAGERLARHGEDVALLEQETLRALDLSGGAATVRLAVNADSLATWFAPVIGAVGALRLDVQIDDQDHSASWLSRGNVSAAITGTAKAAQGCDSTALGVQRYVATASWDFVAKWFADGVTTAALAQAPVFHFNRKDQLQNRWLKLKTGQKLFPPAHYLPSTHTFVDAAMAGAGWGMNPEPLVRNALQRGDLVALDKGLPLDIPLFWQISRRMKPALCGLDRAVREAALVGLLSPCDAIVSNLAKTSQ